MINCDGFLLSSIFPVWSTTTTKKITIIPCSNPKKISTHTNTHTHSLSLSAALVQRFSFPIFAHLLWLEFFVYIFVLLINEYICMRVYLWMYLWTCVRVCRLSICTQLLSIEGTKNKNEKQNEHLKATKVLKHKYQIVRTFQFPNGISHFLKRKWIVWIAKALQ